MEFQLGATGLYRGLKGGCVALTKVGALSRTNGLCVPFWVPHREEVETHQARHSAARLPSLGLGSLAQVWHGQALREDSRGWRFGASSYVGSTMRLRTGEDTPGPCQYTPHNPTATSERRSIGERTHMTLADSAGLMTAHSHLQVTYLIVCRTRLFLVEFRVSSGSCQGWQMQLASKTSFRVE